VPAPRRLGRTEALAELALRYFTGHGPATERDLAYWASLTLTDVRAGLQQVRDQLDSFQHDGRIFWHAPGDPPASLKSLRPTCRRSSTRPTAATTTPAGCSTLPTTFARPGDCGGDGPG
jgi:winged helix DNA-binding protein